MLDKLFGMRACLRNYPNGLDFSSDTLSFISNLHNLCSLWQPLGPFCVFGQAFQAH